MNNLGICIIGAGHMGRIHARAWQQVAGANIVAIADPDRALAQALAAEVGGIVYEGYEAAVSAPAVSVVSICTPTFLHPEITRWAAAQGRHILCEKPIALTLAAAQEMLAVAQAAKVHFAVGLMRRFSANMPFLQRWFAAGHLGQPLLAQTINIVPLRPKRAMHDAQANGGPIIDMIIHFVDTWTLLFQSRPVSVMAQGAILAAERPEIGHIAQKAIDTAAIIVTFESGAVGNIFVSWGMPPEGQMKLHEERVLGPNGQLDMQFGLDLQRAVWHQADGSQTLLCETETSMYLHEIQAFAAAVVNGEPGYETAVAAIEGLKVSLAALESCQTGQVVTL